MSVRNVHGRAKIAVELLNLSKGERIGEGREFGMRETLRHKAQQGGGLGERAAFADQRGNSAFRVYRKVFWAPLGLIAEIDQNRLVGRAGFFERDVRRERTRPGA
jgi:hypothetical protein